MICERCLKELNAAFDFAERSRSAEKLYFAKRREEFEAEQQKPEQSEEAEMTEVEGQREETKIKRMPSIEIKTEEIDINDYSDISDEGEANEASYCEDDEIDADNGGVEESHPMFTVLAATKSSSKLKKVPISTNAKKKTLRTELKSLQCPICFKILSCNSRLRHHIEAVHEKKTRFTCPDCPKAFYYKHDLQCHITQCHTFTNDNTTNSNRPFECDIDNCGKFFKTKKVLKKHQRVHSGELINCFKAKVTYLIYNFSISDSRS
jgi:Zinc finger, C2H2 type